MTKKTGPKETMFTVLAPPELGFYKLVINAARIPKKKAKVIMPVVATFLVNVSFCRYKLKSLKVTKSKDEKDSIKVVLMIVWMCLMVMVMYMVV